MELPAELADFPASIELPVQWGDQDAFGHVNNVVYFRWFESSRIVYLEKLGLDDARAAAGLGPILAAIGCDYRRQVRYPDRVIIGTRVIRLGRTSMTMEHKVWSIAQQTVVADGHGTVVVFDYQTHQARPIPLEIRAQVEALEGRELG